MTKIPLYNCYWCKCAWCALASICKETKCYKCRNIDNKGKIPYIKESCDKFIPEMKDFTWLVKEIQKCDRCKYKRLIDQLLEQLGKTSL